MVRKCLVCSKEFSFDPYRASTAKSCSPQCSGLLKRGGKFSEETRRKMSLSRTGLKHWLFGKKMDAEYREKLSVAHKGNKHSKETRVKMSQTKLANREQSHLWKGGISEENHRLRNSLQMRLWREAVFARDKFTCQKCGIIGGFLQADHIEPFAYFPELRFEVSNGRTLCVPCHLKTETFGGKIRFKNNLITSSLS